MQLLRKKARLFWDGRRVGSEFLREASDFDRLQTSGGDTLIITPGLSLTLKLRLKYVFHVCASPDHLEVWFAIEWKKNWASRMRIFKKTDFRLKDCLFSQEPFQLRLPPQKYKGPLEIDYPDIKSMKILSFTCSVLDFFKSFKN